MTDGAGVAPLVAAFPDRFVHLRINVQNKEDLLKAAEEHKPIKQYVERGGKGGHRRDSRFPRRGARAECCARCPTGALVRSVRDRVGSCSKAVGAGRSPCNGLAAMADESLHGTMTGLRF